MGGLKPTHEITVSTDEFISANGLDQTEEGLQGGDDNNKSIWQRYKWIIIIGLLVVLAGIAVLVIILIKKKGVVDSTDHGLSSKVVLVSWGTIQSTQEAAHHGTGLIARYRGKVGVLTNFHVLPCKENADSYGMIHANYTGGQMSVDQMLTCATPCGGIRLRPTASEGGFFYTGGVQASGHDWSFVGFDQDEFNKQFPNIQPYDLMDTAVADVGDDVTVWHHGAGRALRCVHSTVWDGTGLQGTIVPQLGDPNKLEAGSSGSPIFQTSSQKLIGVFWGVMESAGTKEELQDRFVIIDAVLSQLSSQM